MSTHHSKDRSSLCSFTFVDGRHCRTPRRVGHPYLCAFHAVSCSGGSSDPPARWPRAPGVIPSVARDLLLAVVAAVFRPASAMAASAPGVL